MGSAIPERTANVQVGSTSIALHAARLVVKVSKVSNPRSSNGMHDGLGCLAVSPPRWSSYDIIQLSMILPKRLLIGKFARGEDLRQNPDCRSKV